MDCGEQLMHVGKILTHEQRNALVAVGGVQTSDDLFSTIECVQRRAIARYVVDSSSYGTTPVAAQLLFRVNEAQKPEFDLRVPEIIRSIEIWRRRKREIEGVVVLVGKRSRVFRDAGGPRHHLWKMFYVVNEAGERLGQV